MDGNTEDIRQRIEQEIQKEIERYGILDPKVRKNFSEVEIERIKRIKKECSMPKIRAFIHKNFDDTYLLDGERSTEWKIEYYKTMLKFPLK